MKKPNLAYFFKVSTENSNYNVKIFLQYLEKKENNVK